MNSFAESIAILIVATQVKHLRGRRRRLEGGSGSSQAQVQPSPPYIPDFI